jgi:DNA polymerase-3 subunit delta'
MSGSLPTGRFIVFEGGKGPASPPRPAAWPGAAARGIGAVLTREPGGTPGAEAIRNLLLSTEGAGWGARAEALLFAAARADHVERLIRPALARGDWVICDRFIDSSRAYQGGGNGLSDAEVMALHAIGSEGLLPDCTILLELPAEEAARAAPCGTRPGRPDRWPGRGLSRPRRRRVRRLCPGRSGALRPCLCAGDAGRGFGADRRRAGALDAADMLIGHEQPWETWRAAMAGQRMHHGWLLAGREGLGKASFALEAAAALVAEAGVPQPPPHQHPDILVLEPLPANDDEAKKRDDGRPYARKRNINVEQIRTMLHRLHTRPTLGARRAVIVDAADHLEKGAVNALLKGLEEPPQGTFFLLVVHQLGRLLPTVRSRCQVLRFRPLEPQEMNEAVSLAAPELDAETRSAAIAVAHGSPGAALMFAAHDLGRPLAVAADFGQRRSRPFAARGTGQRAGRPARPRAAAGHDRGRAHRADRGPGPGRRGQPPEDHRGASASGGAGARSADAQLRTRVAGYGNRRVAGARRAD